MTEVCLSVFGKYQVFRSCYILIYIRVNFQETVFTDDVLYFNQINEKEKKILDVEGVLPPPHVNLLISP